MSISNTVALFKILGDPTRLRILTVLMRGELCICDLMAILGLPQSTVSRHMSRLRQVGLVSDRRSGKWVYYQLNEPGNGSTGQFVATVVGKMSEQEPFSEDLRRLLELENKKNCK